MSAKIQLTGEEIISRIYATDLQALPEVLLSEHLASSQPERNLSFANLLYGRIISKTKRQQDQRNVVGIYGPSWSQEHVREAAETHARIIIDAYGATYALPNKYPDENAKAIEAGAIDFYFLSLNGEFVGTACLTNDGGGRGELGRAAASRANVGNSIIQDLRILEWLLLDRVSERFHTLFTTIRTAPDRDIGLDQPMRGGQAVTSQWQKFLSLSVSGVAPLYFKHGSLEQFTIAQLSRAEYCAAPLFVADDTDRHFVESWHEFHGLKIPKQGGSESAAVKPRVKVHAPPPDSDIFDLVHADVVFAEGAGDDLEAAIDRYFDLGSPFIQVAVPIAENSIAIQNQLRGIGFQAFGFEPASEVRSAYLLFGKVKPGLDVVPTYWDAGDEPHPYWRGELAKHALRIARAWPAQGSDRPA